MTRERVVMASVWILVILLVSAAIIVVVTRPKAEDYHHKPAKDHTDLADRINHACKKGFYVVDWSTGDEWNPQPKGVISVTCGSKDQDNYKVYTVAVAR